MKLTVRLAVIFVLAVGILTLYCSLGVTSSQWRQHRDIFVLHRKWRTCTIPKDVTEQCYTNMSSKRHTRQQCSLEKLSHDCDALIEIHGYEKPVDKEELDFPLAFGIKMHTSPQQAEQLLRTIYRPHNIYCIHVDEKADDKVFRQMTSIASCFPNVIMTDRISYVYASFDAVRADLRTMACALDSAVRWKYFMNVAGQEFPLKTNLEMVRILKKLNGTNDIESFPVNFNYQHRFSRVHIMKNDRLMKTSIKKNPPSFDIRKGTQYSAFSRAFVTTFFYDDKVRDIINFFQDTRSPDEHIWATINQLPWIPGGYPVHVRHTPRNEHLSRAVVWQGGDDYKCRGKYVREVCILSMADLPWLLQQPNLFANKFKLDVDSRVLRCLEAVLNQRAMSRGITIDESYIENLPHVKFRRNKSDITTNQTHISDNISDVNNNNTHRRRKYSQTLINVSAVLDQTSRSRGATTDESH